MMRIIYCPSLLLVALVANAPAHAATYQTIYYFGSGTNGSLAALTPIGSSLYGTTQNGGVEGDGQIFSINPDGSNFQSLSSFTNFSSNANPTDPVSALTLGASVLYGTTSGGGNAGGGTVYSSNLDGSNVQAVHPFGPTDALGQNVQGDLTLISSTLYGTASDGGSQATKDGVVYAVNADGSNYHVLHNFGGGASDGAHPFAGLTPVGSTLYGTTQQGGGGIGTVFSINADGSNFHIIHSFGLTTGDGTEPETALTIAGSTIYGSTHAGGAYQYGTVFSMNLDGTNYHILHSFNDADGTQPLGLTLVGSTLYGTTIGNNGVTTGEVFSVGTDSSNFQVIHVFGGTSADGYGPQAGLTLLGQTLFGTTTESMNGMGGTIFAVTVPEPSTIVLAILGGLALLAARRRARQA